MKNRQKKTKTKHRKSILKTNPLETHYNCDARDLLFKNPGYFSFKFSLT